MSDPLPTSSLLSDRSSVTDSVRAQILATEHWSLLATRSMTWNEAFSRATMYITVLSAAVVALALVAQATAFGQSFRVFALFVLPVVLLMGLATFIRLSNVNGDDMGLVIGMNRLRHAYLELAPELEPYFVTSQHDDEVGFMQSYSLGRHLGIGHFLVGTPNLVAAINAVVSGALAALVAATFAAPSVIEVAVGVAAGVAAIAGHAAFAFISIARGRHVFAPRFPS